MKKDRLATMRSAMMAGISVIGCMSVSPVMAQDGGVPTSPTQPTDSDAGQIAEIIVTAQRRAENLQSVPIAVTAATSEKLEVAGIRDTSEIALITPGFQLRNIAGFSIPNIRGLGSNASGPGIENSIGIYLDGVYLEASSSALFSLANIERIEVLKGPQGTLFGRNSTGGVVQVITKRPSFEPTGSITVDIGNYQTGAIDGYVSGGASDTIAADFAFHYKKQGKGWGTNFFNGRDVNRVDDDLIVRSKLLWEPTSRTSILLSANYSYLRSSQLTTQTQVEGFEVSPFNVLGAAVTGIPQGPNGGFYDVNNSVHPMGTIRSSGATLEVQQEISDSVQIKSISAYQATDYTFDFDIDGSGYGVFSLQSGAPSRQFSQELQISSSGPSRLQWTGGLYYFHAKDSFSPYNVVFGPVGSAAFFGGASSATDLTDVSTKINSYAAFGQATYEFLPNTRLTLGGRYTHEKRSMAGDQTVTVDGVVIFQSPVPYPGGPVDPKISSNNFSYRIALAHNITGDILLYASYNTGFKSGGYNLSASATNPPYKPEKVKAKEAGVKADLFGRRARLNISAFHYDYTNIQVNTYTGTTSVVQNGAKAEIYGGEVDAEYRITRNFTLSGGISYVHDRFTSFPDADFTYVTPDCTPTADPTFICKASAKGNKLANSPTFTANVSANYRFEFDWGDIDLNGNYYHSSQYFASYDNNPIGAQKPYDIVNANVSWTSPSKAYRVQAYVKNLLKEKYSLARLISQGGNLQKPAAPRTYGVAFDFNF